MIWDIDLIFGMWVYNHKLQINFEIHSGWMSFCKLTAFGLWNLAKYLVVSTVFSLWFEILTWFLVCECIVMSYLRMQILSNSLLSLAYYWGNLKKRGVPIMLKIWHNHASRLDIWIFHVSRLSAWVVFSLCMILSLSCEWINILSSTTMIWIFPISTQSCLSLHSIQSLSTPKK